jgi:hypothetical protein
MPVQINPHSKFTIPFLREGEVLDARTAATGGEAVKVALLLLVQQDELQHGDRLTVTEGYHHRSC